MKIANSKQDQYQFKIKQIVFGKVKGYPWYDFFTQFMFKKVAMRNLANQLFLGDFTTANLKQEQLQDFDQNYNLLEKKQSKNKKFIQALKIAEKIKNGETTLEQEHQLFIQKTQFAQKIESSNDTSLSFQSEFDCQTPNNYLNKNEQNYQFQFDIKILDKLLRKQAKQLIISYQEIQNIYVQLKSLLFDNPNNQRITDIIIFATKQSWGQLFQKLLSKCNNEYFEQLSADFVSLINSQFFGRLEEEYQKIKQKRELQQNLNIDQKQMKEEEEEILDTMKLVENQQNSFDSKIIPKQQEMKDEKEKQEGLTVKISKEKHIFVVNQKLRKKICLKFAKLLQLNFGFEKESAQNLTLKIEKYIRVQHPYMDEIYEKKIKLILKKLYQKDEATKELFERALTNIEYLETIFQEMQIEKNKQNKIQSHEQSKIDEELTENSNLSFQLNYSDFIFNINQNQQLSQEEKQDNSQQIYQQC